jgi:hypothetical protein
MELERIKNQATEIPFAMITSETPSDFMGGLTVADDCYVKTTGSSWVAQAITDTATGINSSGMYSIELTAAEMNHDMIICKFSVAGAADTMVSIRTFLNDMNTLPNSAQVNSNFNALTDQVAGITSLDAAGTVVIPNKTIAAGTPWDVYRKTHTNPTMYVSHTFSSFVVSGTAPYLTAKKRQLDDDSEAFWTVAGTVSNTTSMSCVFSLDPTSHTNQQIGDDYKYEVQFRSTNGDKIHNAIEGTMRILGTLKLGV